jgi:nitrogen-specific signal transduction histidine kinase
MAGGDKSLKVRSPALDGGSPIENSPLMTELMSFLNKSNSPPPEPIPGGDAVFMEEDRNSPSALLPNLEPDLTKSSTGGNEFNESEKKDNPRDSFLKKDELKPTQSKKEELPNEQGLSFMDSFLIELVHSIKKGLASVYQATVLTMEKCDDSEIRKRSHDQVKEEMKKIDSVLNSVLNFININTPIIKTNTLYTILEEILEANERQFRRKNMKITKRYEKDLPETFIHPEQVRFILHSVIQYAILSTPPNGIIGFLMKTSDSHNGTGVEKPSTENNRRYIEVMIGFNGDGRPINKSENLSETPEDQSKGTADLILKLAKEILERNHGMMVETHGDRPKTLIKLRFPVERRKVVDYEPIVL